MERRAGTVAAVRAGAYGAPAGGPFTMYLGLPSRDVLAAMEPHMVSSVYSTSTQRMSQGHHQTSRGSGISFVPKPLQQGYGAGRPSATDHYMAQRRASGTQSLPELSKRNSDAARHSFGAPPVLQSASARPTPQPGLGGYAVVPQSMAAASPSKQHPASELEPEPVAKPELAAMPSPSAAELDTLGSDGETPGFGAETPGFGKASPSRGDPIIARMNVVVEEGTGDCETAEEPGYMQDQRTDGWTSGGMSPLTPGALAGFGALSPKVVKVPIPKPEQETVIREKINAVTQGGPGGLRRSFRVFDRNGDGSIDHREFDKVLRRYLNIRFEKQMIEKVMAQFDDTGDGKIDFRKFSELVVGSDSRTQTSLTVGTSQIKGRGNVISDDAGNSDMMVRRKINMSFKALRASFRDLVDNKGKISREDLVWVLSRYDVDLVPGQLEALMRGAGAKSETDGITWAGFAEYYRRQEEEAKALSSNANKTAEIKGLSVRNSVQLIREKIDGVMEGGPDGLRRAFRIFDTDMSGDISYEEFDACLRKRLNLRFEPLLLQSILKSYDDTGDGKIDYRKFCEYVMGSTQRTETSLTIGQIPGRSNHVSADSGNSDMMVQRKIRMSFKPLRASFRDLVDGKGGISKKDLAWVLSRYDIDLTSSQFDKLWVSLGCQGDSDKVTWELFHRHFKGAEGDDNEEDMRNQLRVIKGIPVQQAVLLIREKIESAMQGGPDELRRAFRMFDSDMSGGISHGEFDRTLRKRLNLRFDATLLDGVMKAIDDTSSGEIDFRKFCELVMGSTRTTANSLGIGKLSGRGNFVSADCGNSDMMIRRKLRVSYKDIRANFRDVSDAQGAISPDDLFSILSRYDIDMTEEQFGRLLGGVGCVQAADRIAWTRFVEYFRKQEEDEDPEDVRNKLRVIKNIKVDDAIQMIREKIEGIMEGGPDSLRRAFRIFDANMNGSISYAEFEAVLTKKLNLHFDGVLLDGVMKAFDDTHEGSLDYRKFCELVMGSTKATSSSLAMGAQAAHGLHNHISADTGNSDMMVRRKVRMSWKDMRANFRDVADEQGRVCTRNVRDVFRRFDIDLTTAQFDEMCEKTGAAEATGENYRGELVTEQRVKWASVLSYWREESEDEY